MSSWAEIDDAQPAMAKRNGWTRPGKDLDTPIIRPAMGDMIGHSANERFVCFVPDSSYAAHICEISGWPAFQAWKRR